MFEQHRSAIFDSVYSAQSYHLTSGDKLGPYELLLPLPRTGPAQVWIARLIGAGGFRTHLALKTIPRAYLEDLPTERLLLEQVTLAARIRHPNLVETLDLGEHDGTLYVAMEWVDGQPLGAVLEEATQRGGLPLRVAVNLAGQLCRGLHAIHEHAAHDGTPLAVVHGHLSVQNVLLAYNGIVKLSDFGVAQAMDSLSFLTAVNQRNHKLSFAAPEQLSARPVDRRADVFSVATLLYQLTTSRHPFEGGDIRGTLNNICSNQPALPPGPNYPRALAEVLAKALRKAAEERWDSALSLMNALESAMPESFLSTSDQTLAAYLDELCATRKAELRARVHGSETEHDKKRSSFPAGPSGARHSLRAVSLDAPPAVAAAAVSPRASDFALLSRLSPANVWRTSPLAVALSVAFLACVALWQRFDSPGLPTPSSALASQVAVMPEVRVASLPVQQVPSVAAAPTPPPAPCPVPVDSLALEPRASLVPGGRRVTSTSSPVAIPASSAPAREPGVASKKTDAWDPATFGGRY